MSIDQEIILDLIDFRDDVGVLSVFVGITPDRAADPKPSWPIVIRNELRDLRKRAKEDRSHEDWEAIGDRIDHLDRQLDQLFDFSAHGRGRALFAAVSSDQVWTVSIQVPFRDRVILDDNAYVRPLIAAYDEGRPAGIAVVHKGGVRLLEWRLGEAEELTKDAFTIGGRDWRKASGPAPAQPQDTRQGGQKRDQFDNRVDENRLRFMRDRARDIAEIANSRGWDRLVVAGDPRLTKPFAEELNPAGGEQLTVTDLSWEDEAPNEIADQAWETLKTLRHERAVNLVQTAKDRALSGGAGALGLDDVLASLNEGRVERLVFNADVSLSGYRTEAGMLYADNGRPDLDDDLLIEEELLVERAIERTLETGATVTPVQDDAAETLSEHGGIAALLRW